MMQSTFNDAARMRCCRVRELPLLCYGDFHA
jgi:hypothetical protein